MQYSEQLLFLDELVQSRVNTVKSSVEKNRYLIAKDKELQNEIERSKNIIQQCQSKIARLTNSIRIRSAQLQTMEKDIGDLNDGEGYSKIGEDAEQRAAASILNNRQDLLVAAVAAVLMALRKDPKKSELITGFDFYEGDTDNSEGSVDDALIKNYIQTHYEQILDTADMLYDKILKRVQNHTSRSSQKTQCD